MPEPTQEGNHMTTANKIAYLAAQIAEHAQAHGRYLRAVAIESIVGAQLEELRTLRDQAAYHLEIMQAQLEKELAELDQ